MSRSGYSDDIDDQWALIRWRGAVASAIRGKYGQAFLNEMIAAMDALPEPKLIADEIEEDGAVCAIGSVTKARGISVEGIDPENIERIADMLGIADALAKEIVYLNDEWLDRATPEERFVKMRRWAKNEIWNARGCVDDPYSKRALQMSQRLHWKSVIEWNEI